MKIPQRPPDLAMIEKRVFSSAEFFNQIMKEAKKLEASGKYPHWDEFRRHMPIPAGLTHEVLWFGIKQLRSVGIKKIPLRDKKDEFFCYTTTPDVLNEQLYNLHAAAGQISFLTSNNIPGEIADADTPSARQYNERFLIQEAVASSQLEGAATTRTVAKQMIRSKRMPRDDSERMIVNNYHTMQKILLYKDRPLDLELMFEIHRLITEDTFEHPDQVGRFRNDDESVNVRSPDGEIVHEPPKACDLLNRFQAMCDFANGKTPDYFIHPVIRSIILHFWLAYDHPFVDGNGRCARALFYWSMLRQGYHIFEYISISQILLKAPIQYGMAYLQSETDENDLTYFIIYQLQVIQRAIEGLQIYLSKKEKERKDVLALFQAGCLFNYRQQELLVHALHHAGHHYTVEEHKTAHQIVYETARKDLNDLYKCKLLKRKKRGKAFVYISPPDLDTLIQKNYMLSEHGSSFMIQPTEEQ